MGFFIVTLDFIGYTGTVVVLACKEFLSPDIDWLAFYNQLSGYVGLVSSVAFVAVAVYIVMRHRREFPGRRGAGEYVGPELQLVP